MNVTITSVDHQFQQLADFIPQIVWTARPDGYLDYYNKQWYDFTGFEEGYGDQSWLPILHPDDVSMCVDTWYNSVQTGEGYEIEYRFIDRKNPGHYRWFLGRACPIKDEQGRITKWFGTCTDIDDQKRQAELLEQRVRQRTEELDRLNLQLKRSNENLEQFAYVASHDLQEPLRKIQGFGDILATEFNPVLGANGVDMLQRMQSAASRMSGLIRDLLTYSRLTAQHDLFEPVNLNHVVVDVMDDLEFVVQQTGATIHIDPMPVLQGNPFQLRQLLENLLANALKFTRSSVTPAIRVSSRQMSRLGVPTGLLAPRLSVPLSSTSPDDTFWEISVADNGIGFDEKQLDRIFQVFQRLHSKNHYPGTGVGLAICRKVTEAHGGAITAYSQPGQGTTFLVYLPV